MGTVRIKFEDEETGAVLAEYGGIPRPVANRALEMIAVHLQALKGIATVKETISSLLGAFDEPKKRRKRG